MAYREKSNVDQTTSIPLSRLATPAQISSYIKRLITASQYDYHETEAMEVQSITLNEVNNRGSISGTFLNSGDFIGNVRPLFGNLTTVPVIGEHVTGTDFNGQYYYSTIINRKGSINENSIPGASGTYTENTKYGKTFERKKVKPIEIGEGCILFEGRFGQTIHLDGHHNKPSVKISTHIDESDGDFRKESIDGDDSSIYLLSRGMSDKFDGNSIVGKKVLIQSDGIFITGRQEVKINAPNLKVTEKETKLGSRDAKQPVVLGDDLKEILQSIINQFSTIAGAFGTDAVTPKGAAALTKASVTLNTKMTSLKLLSKTVKTV